jgi:hypothetical protein
MENLGFWQILLLLLLFILVPLMNSIMQRVRRGLEEGTSAEEKPPVQAPGHAQAAPAPPPSPRASRRSVRQLQSRIVSTPPSRSNFVKRSLLPTTRDTRRGIILMTVLGPCRAFNPPD